MPMEWDKTGEKYFETGVDHAILFDMDDEGQYSGGTVWNGITGVEENPEGGDPNDFWADNIKYASLMGAEKFKCTIKAYTYPDKFMKYDGSATIAAGVYAGLQGRPAFGFAYRTIKGNDVKGTELGYLWHLVYGCKASPSSKTHDTVNDSPDIVEFSWEVDSTPAAFTGENAKLYKPTSTFTFDSTKMAEEKWTALENMLMGGTMPDPDGVITLMNA